MSKISAFPSFFQKYFLCADTHAKIVRNRNTVQCVLSRIRNKRLEEKEEEEEEEEEEVFQDILDKNYFL